VAFNPLHENYVQKREAYKAAGNAARGTPEGSPERQRYARARAEYHEAGKALKASRGR
jgi:hypothetical protein